MDVYLLRKAFSKQPTQSSSLEIGKVHSPGRDGSRRPQAQEEET